MATVNSNANRATRRAAAKPAAKKATASKAAVEAKANEIKAHATLADLDAEVAEISDVPPFVFDLGEDENGEHLGEVTIGHPGDVPYSIAASRDLDKVFAFSFSDEDWAKFVQADLTSLQAGALFKLWRAHYGMGEQGE